MDTGVYSGGRYALYRVSETRKEVVSENCANREATISNRLNYFLILILFYRQV